MGFEQNINSDKAGFICLLVAFIFFACDTNSEQEGETGKWDNFVEFREGNFPLILVAAHGGDQNQIGSMIETVQDLSCYKINTPWV